MRARSSSEKRVTTPPAEPADAAAEPEPDVDPDAEPAADPPDEDTADEDATEGEPAPETLRGHVRATVDSGEARLLDGEMCVLTTAMADEAFASVEDADPVPTALVLDGELTQRLLDVCAQRGVEQVVATSLGDLVKRPTGVRIRTAADLLEVPDQ